MSWRDYSWAVKVVAEAGQIAGNDLDLAKELATGARDAGCWGFKIQMLTPSLIASKTAAKYWEHGNDRTQREVFEDNGSLTRPQIVELRNHCEDNEIRFIVTPFDVGAVEFCQEIRVDAIKIASGDITNEELCIAVRRTALPIILSTGGATAPEVTRAAKWLGLRDIDTILACSLQYPTHPTKAHFNRIAWLCSLDLGVDVGYSDHTLGIWSAAPLVALGARMIEKHVVPATGPAEFGYRSQGSNPDYEIGLDPSELKEFVAEANRTTTACEGFDVGGPHDGEQAAVRGARRTLYWTQNVNALGGMKVTANMVTALRPGPDKKKSNDVGAEEFSVVVGSYLRRDVHKDTRVQEQDI